MKKTLFLILLLVTLLLSKKILPQRGFKLTENQGVIFSEIKQVEQNKRRLLIDVSSFYQDKTNYRPRIYQKRIPGVKRRIKRYKFTFFYPRKLVHSDAKLTGFEEYFTLPSILEEEIYSYPGFLINPDKTESAYSLSIRIFTTTQKRENIETWLEKFQEGNPWQKELLDINGLDFVKYQGLFGQKYNSIFLTSGKDLTAVINLVSQDEKNSKLGSEMLEPILATFKWL